MNPLRLELGHAPASAAQARAAVREHVTDHLAGDPALGALLDDAALVASELVTNAVRHGRGPVVLTVLVVPREAGGDAEVVLGCSDGGRWRTHTPADGGRGLPLVRTVSQSLDIDTTGGTTVTARLVR